MWRGGVPVENEAETANPASVHGEEQGGTVEIIETVDPAMVTVALHFSNESLGDPCGEVFPASRQVPADTPAVEAVAALLGGPTPDEQAKGHSSWFSGETEGLLRSGGSPTARFGWTSRICAR